jgi:hypothetical protein
MQSFALAAPADTLSSTVFPSCSPDVRLEANPSKSILELDLEPDFVPLGNFAAYKLRADIEVTLKGPASGA